MCYGHAVQHSKTPERFGKGAVEGVIGPEAANNSKEGGALLPTLFFGIPGSSGMAVMLGAFVVLGVQPGPEMAGERLDLVWVLIWTLVVANVLGGPDVPGRRRAGWRSSCTCAPDCWCPSSCFWRVSGRSSEAGRGRTCSCWSSSACSARR